MVNRHMKRQPISVIREIQIKITRKYHFTPISMDIIHTNPSKRQETTSIGRDVEKRKDLCTFGGNVNWFSHYGK